MSGSVVVSQISAGHKNQLRLEVVTDGATLAFDQEHPDTLWVGRRGPSEIVERDPNQLDPTAAPYATVPPGHPQGYQDCFDAFVADTCAPSTRATAPRSTGCRPSPTAPGPSASPTRCSGRPATGGVGRHRARRSHHEARVPHRLPPEAEPRGHLRLGRGRGLRGPRGGGLARPRRPPVHRHPPRRRRLRREGGRRDPRRCSTATASTLSSLAYYDNNLDPDPAERAAHHEHVHRCIDAAALPRLPHRRHLRRAAPGPVRRREPPRRRGGVRPARRPRRRGRA